MKNLKKYKPFAIAAGVTLFTTVALAAALPSELEQREKARAMAAQIYSDAVVENQLASLEVERVSEYKRRTQASEIFAGENFCFHHYRLVEQKLEQELQIESPDCNLFR